MEKTIYNPQKGRLETIDIELTDENTTWFDSCLNEDDIYTVTDFNGGLLISESGYSYPVWIYDISRRDINYDRRNAKKLKGQYL